MAHVEEDAPLAGRPDLVADPVAGQQALRTVAEAIRDHVPRPEEGQLLRERPVVVAPGSEQEREASLAAAASPSAMTARGSVRPHVSRLTLTAIPQIARPPFRAAARTAAAQAAPSTSSRASQHPPSVASPRRDRLIASRTRVRERSITVSWYRARFKAPASPWARTVVVP